MKIFKVLIHMILQRVHSLENMISKMLVSRMKLKGDLKNNLIKNNSQWAHTLMKLIYMNWRKNCSKMSLLNQIKLMFFPLEILCICMSINIENNLLIQDWIFILKFLLSMIITLKTKWKYQNIQEDFQIFEK